MFQFFRNLWNKLCSVLSSIRETIICFCTNQSTLQRILENEENSDTGRALAVKNYAKARNLENFQGSISASFNSLVESSSRPLESNSQLRLRSLIARLKKSNFCIDWVEMKCNEEFSFDNETHKSVLDELWKSYLPGKDIPSGISIAWQQLGFQGEDPSSDFRGGGMLSLVIMVAGTIICKETTKRVFNATMNKESPLDAPDFAITSINVTGWIRQWLKEDESCDRLSVSIKKLFFIEENRNKNVSQLALLAVTWVHWHILDAFMHVWTSSTPRLNVMDFNEVVSNFKSKYLPDLFKDAIPGSPWRDSVPSETLCLWKNIESGAPAIARLMNEWQRIDTS